MKAEQIEPKPAFKPVVLTLETQAEVDAVFAFLNHPRLTNAVGLSVPSYKPLLPFKCEDNAEAMHRKLCSLLR